MRLRIFQDKLLAEVDAALALDASDQRVQPHAYCIAVLLRRIVERCQVNLGIKVHEYTLAKLHAEKVMKMGQLCNSILHAWKFLPDGRFVAGRGFNHRLCRIVTSRQIRRGIAFILVDMDEFFTATRSLITHDEALAEGLLRHARTKMEMIIRADPTTVIDEDEIIELLIDTFDFARTLGKASKMTGSVLVHANTVGPLEAKKLTQRRLPTPQRSFLVSHADLAMHLFAGWTLVPFRQLQTPDPSLDINGDNNQSWRITASELLGFIKAAQQEW